MILFNKNLKKGKKWIYEVCLYSLALVLLPAILSFCFITENTSALKYSFDTFPLYQSRFPNGYSSTGVTFGFWFDSSLSSDLSFSDNLFSLDKSFKFPRYLSDNLCFDRNYKTSIFTSTSVSSSNSSFIWSGEGFGFYRSFGFSECFYNLTSYSYDSFFGNTYYLSNGEVEKLVNIDEVLFSSSNSDRYLKKVTVPLNFDSSVTFPANTPLSFSFGLVTGSSLGFSNFVTPNVSFDVYYDSGEVFYHDSVSSCSIDDNYGFLILNPDLSVMGAYTGFLVTCDFTPSVDVSYFSSSLSIYGGSSFNPSSFLSYSSSDGLYFAASYLVTDNDDTWSGQNISPIPTGEDIENAPGYSQLYGSSSPVCVPGDFSCNLSNLFSFSIFNPFAPIFNLFTTGQSCASIPIIAGMLHAESDQYCSWFPLSVRNVLTPVFSLASVMLLFGFIVRWLGASSGNFFEDAGHIESPGGYTADVRGRNVKKRGWRRSA